MKKSLYGILFTLLIVATALSVTFAQTDQDCLSCHADSSMMGAMGIEDWEPLVLDAERYTQTIHSQMGGCVNCHYDISEFPHADTVAAVDCGMCHYDAQQNWAESAHGLSVQEGSEDAATCSSCHTDHYQFSSSDSLSRVHPTNEWQTCAECHSNEELIQEYDIPQPDAVAMYKTSIHGRELIVQGNLDAASCSDCHGSHKILRARNFESTMN